MPNNAPGIQATINTAPLGQPAPAQNSDMLFVVGYAVWGPYDQPTLVTSWNDYVSKFGGLHPNSDMARAVNLFFKNGGQRATILRAFNGNAGYGFVEINDSHGTPVKTLTARAKYASAQNFVDVQVIITLGTLPETRKIILESSRLGFREVFDNFKVTLSASEQQAINDDNSPLNTIATVNSRSKLVVLEKNSNNAHVAPANLPATFGGSLSGGSDDIGDIDDLGNSITLLTEDFGPGTIIAPGFTGYTASLIAQAEETKRIAIIELDANNDVTDALANRIDFDSSFAALYYPPRLQMRDLNGGVQIKEYSPVGMVAGIFARAENEIGVHKAPANYRLAEVIGYDGAAFGQLNESLRATLNEKQINAIVKLPEQGIKVYGARVLKSYGRITAIHEQRVLNAIYYRLKRSLQEFVFQPANQSLFREIRSTCAQYMRELYRTGALYSPTGNEEGAYRVICDESNNPPEQLQQNKVSVDVWVHIVGMAEQVLVNINSVPLATEFDTLNTGGNN